MTQQGTDGTVQTTPFAGETVATWLRAQPPVDEATVERVRAVLPAAWQTDFSIVWVHDGFAVGFLDSVGVRHVLRAEWLEAGRCFRRHGQRLGVTYFTTPGSPPPEGSLGWGQALADAVLADEEALTEALPADGPTAPPSGSPTVSSGDPLDEWIRGLLPSGRPDGAVSLADENLARRVTERLPKEFRGGAVVRVSPDGFVVGFRDSTGARHALRALRLHPLDAGFCPVAEGNILGFSYLPSETPLDPADIARYRSIAETFIAVETRLAEILRPSPTQSPVAVLHPPSLRWEFDLTAYPPALATVTPEVRAHLPEHWRKSARVVVLPGGFAIGVNDTAGVHVLRVQARELGLVPLARSQNLEVLYLDSPSVGPSLGLYASIAAAILADEDPLVSGVRKAGAPTRISNFPPRPEFTLSDHPPADADFAGRVRGLLPADWRLGSTVVFAPEGFAVGVTDPSGTTHVLRVREISPEFQPLREGKRLSVSYLLADDPPSPATLSLYTSVAVSIVANEDPLAAVWSPPEPARPEESGGFVPGLTGSLTGATLRGTDPANGTPGDFEIFIDTAAQRVGFVFRPSLLAAPTAVVLVDLTEFNALLAEYVPPGTAVSIRGEDPDGHPRTMAFLAGRTPSEGFTLGVYVTDQAIPRATLRVPRVALERVGQLLFHPGSDIPV